MSAIVQYHTGSVVLEDVPLSEGNLGIFTGDRTIHLEDLLPRGAKRLGVYIDRARQQRKGMYVQDTGQHLG